MKNKIKEYFKNTPAEQMLEDWNKTAEFDKIKPTADEYLNSVKKYSEEEVKKLIKIIEWYDEASDVRPDYDKEADGLTLWEWLEQFKNKLC